jgi:hypothetical protein
MGMACSTHGGNRNAYRMVVGERKGKGPLERLSRRWVDNIKMGLREKVWGDMNWIYLAQDRDQWMTFVNTVINVWVP